MSAFDAFCYCDSYSEFVVTETRKAKKPHRCGECYSQISPGETYEHARGKCEGEMFTAKTCADCLALQAFVRAHVPCLCLEFGNATEVALAAAAAANNEAPGTLFGAMRRMVAIKRRPKYLKEAA